MNIPGKKYSILASVCCFLILSISQAACAQARTIPEAKRIAIDSILKQTGAQNTLGLMTQQLTSEILGVLQNRGVRLDEDLIKLVEHEAKKVIYEEFVLNNQFNEIFYSLYDEYFSTDELKEIARFYNSSTGRRLLLALPEISQRSMNATREQSAGIGSKVQQRLMQRFDEAEMKLKTLETKQAEPQTLETQPE